MGKCKAVPVYVPNELLALIQRRKREEHFKSTSSYILSLIIWDLVTRTRHEVTGPLLNDPHETLDKAVDMIVRDFDKVPRASSQWLRARIEELIAEDETRVTRLSASPAESENRSGAQSPAYHRPTS